MFDKYKGEVSKLEAELIHAIEQLEVFSRRHVVRGDFDTLQQLFAELKARFANEVPDNGRRVKLLEDAMCGLNEGIVKLTDSMARQRKRIELLELAKSSAAVAPERGDADLACPFCGVGPDHVTVESVSSALSMEWLRSKWQATCLNCGASGPTGPVLADALAGWKLRASVPAEKAPILADDYAVAQVATVIAPVGDVGAQVITLESLPDLDGSHPARTIVINSVAGGRFVDWRHFNGKTLHLSIKE